MRALRVVGLDEDGETVICEDPENGERFSVPADERLRAAARGDLTRLGQVQIELEAQMRPREIQARVRSGASVEQIAAASGLPEHRVERYAYPVLLERTQVAERAQRAHPIREDGPDVQTLGEVVAHTFGMRGHDYADTAWDSWRGEDGKWLVQLRWQAGKSENTAYWVFHPGAHGGTVAALDEHAADLLDPSPNRPLRTVRPVTELAREALELDQSETEETVPEDFGLDPAPAPAAEQAPPRLEREERLQTDPDATPLPARPSPQVPPIATGSRAGASPAGAAIGENESAGTRRHDPGERAKAPATEAAEVGDDPSSGAEEPTPEEATAEAGQRRERKNHPIVPSWEDVLLGVRSHR